MTTTPERAEAYRLAARHLATLDLDDAANELFSQAKRLDSEYARLHELGEQIVEAAELESFPAVGERAIAIVAAYNAADDPSLYLPSLEQRAHLAREVYWSTIDQLDRATSTPSPESLRGWIAVVEAVDGAK